MKTGYRNFVFDLYGTLADIRTDETLPELWRDCAEWFARRGMEYTPESLRQRYESICRELQLRKENELAIRNIPGPAEIDLRNVWNALAAEKNGCLTAEEKAEFSRLFRERSTVRLRLFPYAADILRMLHAEGKTITLLTNAQECFTLHELEILGIGNAFDQIFISSRAGVKKPSPAFFALLCDARLQTKMSLMIGNDEECDCRGAAAAGMDSLFIRTPQSPAGPSALPENCREIHSLSEIIRFI